jgi:FlaA1/EpsC-like NDP-sugar epimerase
MSIPFLHYRRPLIAASHLGIVALSLLIAFWLRFEFQLDLVEVTFLNEALWIAIVVKMGVFLAARFDRGWWRFVGIPDLIRVFFANVIASAIFAGVCLAVIGRQFPRSVYLIDFLVCFVLTGAARLAVRLYNEAVTFEISQTGKGVLVYGAGTAGMMLMREIRSNPSLGYRVIGFLDDNVALRSAAFLNVPVLGEGREAAAIVDKYRNSSDRIEQIIIAMPSANGRQMREALANCRAAGVPCKTIPGIAELLREQVLSTQIRNVSVDDLLGREQVRLEEDRIQQEIRGCSVLVTGAAGSIGSELCRQISRFQPGRLVLFDQAESELYKIHMELHDKFPSQEFHVELGDIRDHIRIGDVLERHSVDSIFHAAAYKHVPMMETHILEAVRNNIFGTWNLVKAACRNDVSNFVMISSDKAVNPTSIMGVTKRVAELIVAAASDGAAAGTKFVSVRFGNVLGSNGSVVPIFQSQIAAGGPVTVTHPEMNRYFMSIREAVQLVLQASTMGNGCELFVLDMGEPVKIMDLATNMIRLAGLIPGEDIEIRITGLRPGEKLFEELTTQSENIMATYHEKIKIFKGPRVDRERIEDWMEELNVLMASRDPLIVVDHLKKVVPEYRSNNGHKLDNVPPAVPQRREESLEAGYGE